MEEADESSGARIVSLAPGIIDTDMQAQMRAADPERFPSVTMCEDFRLHSPAEAASEVLAFLARSDFGMEPIADVRD